MVTRLTLLASGTATIALLAAGSGFSSAATAARPQKSPELDVVAMVPGTNQAWADGIDDNTAAQIFRHLKGKAWSNQSVPFVNEGNEYGDLAVINANSVWLTGGTPTSTGSAAKIWRYHAGTFHEMALPSHPDYAVLVADASSSASNAWAVGDIGNNAWALHWRGQSWASTPTPGNIQEMSHVATTAPNNAWAIGDPNRGKPVPLHWNGRAWSVSPYHAPPGVEPQFIATAGPKRAYIAGSKPSSDGRPSHPYIGVWNGKRWTTAKLPKLPNVLIRDITAIGSTAFAVGTRPTAQGDFRPLILNLHHGKWRTQSAPHKGVQNWLNGVSASSTGRATAVGWYANTLGGPKREFALVYNGHSWTRSLP